MGTPASSFAFRRYFSAKYTTTPEIRMVKNAVRATRKKYKASTRPAIVDACWGNNWVCIAVLQRGRYAAAVFSLRRSRRVITTMKPPTSASVVRAASRRTFITTMLYFPALGS